MGDIQREAGSAVKPRGRREAGRARRRPPEVANAAFLSGRVPVSVPAMKVRLSDSMVRFRLSPAEASDWLATGTCAGGVRVGAGESDHWSYRLEVAPRDGWQLSVDAGRLVVEVPVEAARAWGASASARLEHTTPWGTRLRIERDLGRRGPRDRDDASA